MPAPIYFLHVPKCAGTTLRLLFENAFPADRIMAAYASINGKTNAYNSRDLPDYRGPMHGLSLYRGHFGWDLLTLQPGLNWRLFTVLREPTDRLLSQYGYLKQLGRLPAAVDFETWIHRDINVTNLMTSYFARNQLQRTVKGCEAVLSAVTSASAEALANLSKCEAVGVCEAMEDTVNLFASKADILPPTNTVRNNPTLNRMTRDSIPARVKTHVNALLESDYALYAKGCEIFHREMELFGESISVESGQARDAVAVRQHLRTTHLRRFAAEQGQLPARKVILWKPDDPFLGENLHEREEHHGERLRWTGPDRVTRFHMRLDLTSTWALFMTFHAATPLAHLQAAHLNVNGKPLPLTLEERTDGSFLAQAVIGMEILACSSTDLAHFELETPVIRGANEFRMLGVAMTSIMLRAI
jgi:hypothetical protein